MFEQHKPRRGEREVRGPSEVTQSFDPEYAHDFFLSSQTDSFFLACKPAMNRWAIVFRPLGCEQARASVGLPLPRRQLRQRTLCQDRSQRMLSYLSDEF
jgi:hypothetical protein